MRLLDYLRIHLLRQKTAFFIKPKGKFIVFVKLLTNSSNPSRIHRLHQTSRIHRHHQTFFNKSNTSNFFIVFFIIYSRLNQILNQQFTPHSSFKSEKVPVSRSYDSRF